MTDSDSLTPPTGSLPKEQWYDEDERRRGSHVLSYGSAWHDPDWTVDRSHVIEIFWIGKTHEVVAYYITYDWDRLSPGRLDRDAATGAALEIGADVGLGVGRVLGDIDLATSDIHVLTLGQVKSDLECHRLLWDWRWLQHHPDGYATLSERVRKHGVDGGKPDL